MRLSLLVVILGLWGSLAAAADSNEKFAIKGGGLQSCESFLAAWDSGSRDLSLFAGWIDGYITGLNQLTPQVYDLTPWQNTQTMLGLTKSVCDQMPGDTRIMDAFHQVMRLIAPDALTSESQVIGLNHEGKTALVYIHTLEQIKARLTAAGHDAGPPDDSFTEETAAAIAEWQAGHDLPQTGLPDQKTLFQMFYSKE